MKKILILFGPPAVGKMTVGKELEKLTDLKLFHNHMTIELLLPFFDFDSIQFKKLTGSFRRQIISEVANSDHPGLIFTFVWNFASIAEKEFIDSLTSIFHEVGGESYYVELEANQKERLKRNREESRLIEKPSKRDIEWSDNNLIECVQKFKLNLSKNDKFYYKNYLKINNQNLSATEAAKKIQIFLEN